MNNCEKLQTFTIMSVLIQLDLTINNKNDLDTYLLFILNTLITLKLSKLRKQQKNKELDTNFELSHLEYNERNSKYLQQTKNVVLIIFCFIQYCFCFEVLKSSRDYN